MLGQKLGKMPVTQLKSENVQNEIINDLRKPLSQALPKSDHCNSFRTAIIVENL